MPDSGEPTFNAFTLFDKLLFDFLYENLYRSSCTLVYSPLKYRGGSCGEKDVPKR
nr:MAG TPA: hypothetical protein [Caudoviricetes sp.]